MKTRRKNKSLITEIFFTFFQSVSVPVILDFHALPDIIHFHTGSTTNV
uniref:Uncharacterized protein n=1 Tax=Lepeophtheirus salmonis TaxID=72036 RepID=A0A0K2UBD6_LEPSM